jgi:hypothetical protein
MISRYWCCCIAVLLLASCSSDNVKAPAQPAGVAATRVERGPVTVSIEVVPNPARLSDEPTLTLTIESEQGVRVEKPPFGDGIGDFLIRGFQEPLPEIRDDREITRQVYTLEPTRTGSLLIDPISIVFHDERPQGDGKSHRVETEAIEVAIDSVVEAEMASLDDLAAMAQPVPIDRPGVPGWIWLTGVAIAGALAACMAWWLSNRRRQAAEYIPTPYEVAMRELAVLEKADAAQHEVKKFYVQLTGIVRRYIEQTTSVHAAEQTTEEFLREITGSDQFERAQRDRLKSFLESADLVKFAAHHPTVQDVEEALSRARDFIRPLVEEVAA